MMVLIKFGCHSTTRKLKHMKSLIHKFYKKNNLDNNKFSLEETSMFIYTKKNRINADC